MVDTSGGTSTGWPRWASATPLPLHWGTLCRSAWIAGYTITSFSGATRMRRGKSPKGSPRRASSGPKRCTPRRLNMPRAVHVTDPPAASAKALPGAYPGSLVPSRTSQYGRRSPLSFLTVNVSSNGSPIMKEPCGDSRVTRSLRASSRDQMYATTRSRTRTYANVYARRTPVIPAKNASTATQAIIGTRAVTARSGRSPRRRSRQTPARHRHRLRRQHLLQHGRGGEASQLGVRAEHHAMLEHVRGNVLDVIGEHELASCQRRPSLAGVEEAERPAR